MSSNALLFYLVLLVLENSITFILGSRTFTSHRLIQYEKNRQPLGCQSSQVDHLSSPLKGTHDLGRNMAVARLEDVTLTLLKSLHQRRAQSLLIVLPTDLSTISDSIANRFRKEIEKHFIENSFDFSIFFAMEDDVTNDVLTNAYSMSNPGNPLSLSNNYHLKGSETSETITGIQYTNVFGIMRSTNENDQKENEQAASSLVNL